MAPRAGAFVKIVSPHSGNITVPSRSASLCAGAAAAQRHCDRALRYAPHRGSSNNNNNSSASISKSAMEQDKSSVSAHARATSSVSSSSLSHLPLSRGRRRGRSDEGAQHTSILHSALPRFASRTHHTTTTTQQQQQQQQTHAQPQDEWERVRAMLAAAGEQVLRKGVRVGAVYTTTQATPSTTTTKRSGSGNDADVHTGVPPLQLPARVPPHTHTDSDKESCSEDEDDASRRRDDSMRGTRKRTRARGDVTRQQQTTTQAAAHHASNDNSDDDNAATMMVCPGMFAGVSAVPLTAQLFDDAYNRRSSDTSPQQQHQHSSRATATSSRCCVQPLWTLIGTYKTALSSLVDVNGSQGCIQWHQRNPQGGRQQLRVPLRAVYEAVVTAVTQTAAPTQQQQQQQQQKQKQTVITYTLVVRAHARPSQVVFAFATRAEAVRMRALLRLSSSSTATTTAS